MNHHFTTVKELPDSEKPYEKFLISGVESLSDAELIAVIIRSGTRGTRSVEVAQELLRQDVHVICSGYAEDSRNRTGEGDPVKMHCRIIQTDGEDAL